MRVAPVPESPEEVALFPRAAMEIAPAPGAVDIAPGDIMWVVVLEVCSYSRLRPVLPLAIVLCGFWPPSGPMGPGPLPRGGSKALQRCTVGGGVKGWGDWGGCLSGVCLSHPSLSWEVRET